MDSKIKVILRVAEKQNKNDKKKPSWVNNENCLKNALRCFQGSEIYVFGDRLQETKELTQNVTTGFFETKNHGNASSFMEVLEYALDNFRDDDIVYLLEDDYIHRLGSEEAIREGLGIARYVSLYNHPDKYQYDFNCKMFLTKSTHWRTASSTTMTFASTVRTLRFDYEIFKRYCEGQNIPQDYYIFNTITGKNDMALVTPVPGFATHGETQWLAPLIDWEKQV